MSHGPVINEERHALVRDLIGGPVPRLMCPPVTHYLTDGALDRARMAAHWAFMAPYVNTFLVPGTTGDGWEMNEVESRALLDFTIELAGKFDARILAGVLAGEAVEACERIQEMLTEAKARAGTQDIVAALSHCRILAFTVCPPRGAELTQDTIEAGLDSILALGAPTALYQLPQVTQNEMSPAVVARLAARHPNLLLLKDSSGADRVALADKERSGVLFVRGAEGNYAEWLRESGGPYHGLLLSSANCFPRELKSMIEWLESGKRADAEELSNRLTRVMEQALKLGGELPAGNAYANANKAMDHFMAHGPDAERLPSPRLHADARLPQNLLVKIKDILRTAALLPERGYLNE